MSYERQEEILREEIRALNKEFGLGSDDDYTDRVKITFGYIGNGTLGPKGWDLSDCIWFVFLPHPGRVGKDGDRLGGFKTGSLEGILATRRALKEFAKGVRLARELGL